MENNNAYSIINIKLSAHKTPEFKEEKQKDWVIYGTDRSPDNNGKNYYNNYGAYLNYLYNRSSKHNAFINGKVHYICGNGVAFDTNGLTVEQIAVANEFLNKPNQNGDTLKDVIRKCVIDKKIYGGFYREIITKKSGKGFEELHMPWNNLRISKDGKGYWFSKDWSKSKQSEEDTGLEFIPNFDPEKPQTRSIIAYKEYRPDLDFYPLPDYIASAVYAEVDVEISNYRLNAIKSGFNVGTIVSFNNGKPSPEDKESVENGLKGKFKGTDQANALMITFSASKESAPTVLRLTPQNVDEQLNGLNDQVIQELIIGHRVTNPALVGIQTSGKLGDTSGESIEKSFNLLKNGYIIPNQREVEAAFNYTLSLRDFGPRIYLKDVEPINQTVTSDQKWEVMTEPEKREWAGLPPVEEKVKPVVSSTVHRFNNDCCDHSFSSEEENFAEESVEVFRQIGEDSDSYEFVSQKYIFDADSDSIFESEVTNYQFDLLEGDVKLLYRNIIDLLKKDPLMPNDVIAKTLKTPLNRVNVAVKRLIADGAVNVSEKLSGDQKSEVRTPTKEAIKVTSDQGSKTGELKIMYTYEARPGLKPLLDTTRPFCRKLIESKKLFTRQQIEQISAMVGFDVWTKRGGWWTQKGGAVTTPFCRHVWVQNVVRKK